MTTVLDKTSKSSIQPKLQDASTLLRVDHKLVTGMFEAYEKASTKAMKKILVNQICKELSVDV